MKTSLLASLASVCLLACVAGCTHHKGKCLEFTISPNASAKTVAVQCTGSSSGKCGFAFAGAHPSDLLIDVGANATVTDIAPGAMYCSGTVKPVIDKCTQSAVPDHEATVKKQQTNPPAHS